MSMNLHCNLIDLQQTPTQITNMCLVQPDGTISWEVTGKKARHALWIYIQWLYGTLNGMYENVGDAEFARENVEKQVAAIKKVMKTKSLRVSKQ